MTFLVYASERGFTKGIAEAVFREVPRDKNLEIMAASDLTPQVLPEMHILIYFTSTFFSGQHPRMSERLYEMLSAHAFDLVNVRFAVAGVGSSAFAYTYQRAAIQMNQVLAASHGHRITQPLLFDRKKLDENEIASEALHFVCRILDAE